MQVSVVARTNWLAANAGSVCEMAEKPFGAYGVGNTFPKEASNTEDWLDAIGLVRSALAASQSPIVTRVWCLRPAEPLQGSSSGHEPGRRREHDRQREEGESADRRPTQASGGVLSAHTARALGSRVCGSSAAAHGCAGIGSAGAQSDHGGEARGRLCPHQHVVTAGQVQLDLLPLHRLDDHEAVHRGDDLLRRGGAAR